MTEEEIASFIHQFNTLHRAFITLAIISKKNPLAPILLPQLLIPMSKQLDQISREINKLINTAKNTSGESPEIFQEISTRLKEVNNIVENTKFTLLQFGIFPSGSVVDAPSLHSLHKPGM